MLSKLSIRTARARGKSADLFTSTSTPLRRNGRVRPHARVRRGPPRTAPSARTHGSCVTVQERQDDSNGQTGNGAAPRRRPERQRHDHIFVVGWCRSCPDCCGRCRCAARSRQSLPVRPRDTSTASRCRRLRRDDSKTLSCLTCATFPRVQRVRNEHARSSLPRRTSPARLAAPDGTFRKRPSHHRRCRVRR